VIRKHACKEVPSLREASQLVSPHRREELSMHLFGEAQRAMAEISQEADFFAKARKKSRPIVQGDYAFAGTR